MIMVKIKLVLWNISLQTNSFFDTWPVTDFDFSFSFLKNSYLMSWPWLKQNLCSEIFPSNCHQIFSYLRLRSIFQNLNFESNHILTKSNVYFPRFSYRSQKNWRRKKKWEKECCIQTLIFPSLFRLTVSCFGHIERERNDWSYGPIFYFSRYWSWTHKFTVL